MKELQKFTANGIRSELGISGYKLNDTLAKVESVGEDRGHKLYLMKDVVKALYENKTISLDEARKRKLSAEAELQELELKKQKGILIPLDLIEQQWSSIVHSCKQKMRSIPNKLAPILAVESNIEVCKNLLNKEIHLALDELSKNKEVPLADSEELGEADDSNTEEVQTTKAPNSKRVG